MTIVDIFILLLVVATIVRGLEVGFMRQAGSLLGLLGGLILGSFLASLIGGSAALSLIIIALSVVGLVAAGELLSNYAKRAIHWRPVHRLDQILGGFMGALTCLALVWFGSALISGIPSTSLQRDIRDSRIIMWLDSSLPPVTDALSQLNELFAGIELPGISLPNEEPALDVDETPLPPIEQFAGVIEQSMPALTRIEGRSCKGLGTGSGFVIEPGIIITNAHVVAGMTRPYAKDSTGKRYSTRVIGFDAALDIAVLRTDTSLDQTLALSDGLVPIATEGVVMGFPGGAALTSSSAVVMERFTALGSDIFGDGRTSRDVYALKTVVREGNSGGPLLSGDGNVIGVIFARSLSHDTVGYALTMPAVIGAIDEALANPSAGQSARCAVSS